MKTAVTIVCALILGTLDAAAAAGAGATDASAGNTSETVKGGPSAMVLFLHHSTGGVIWNGGVAAWLAAYNAAHGTAYQAVEQAFPKSSPYGWANYPYDYWNIWVAHAGPAPFQEESTLEMLAPEHDVIVFKHCYPVSNIEPDTGAPDIASDAKRLENYYLQYAALKAKMREFPDTRFIVWTGAALTASSTTEANAQRARQFFGWVRDTWDEPGDNIFVWDLFELETDGGLYLKPEYAAGAGDSHPSAAFAQRTAPLFAQRLVDVIEGRGDSGSVTGVSASRP
jgi:hypothetical protein